MVVMLFLPQALALLTLLPQQLLLLHLVEFARLFVLPDLGDTIDLYKKIPANSAGPVFSTATTNTPNCCLYEGSVASEGKT